MPILTKNCLRGIQRLVITVFVSAGLLLVFSSLSSAKGTLRISNNSLILKGVIRQNDTAKIWRATLNGDSVLFDFDYLSAGIDQSSTWFFLKDLSGSKPFTAKKFEMICDAGIMHFKGSLQNGIGHCKFVPNKYYEKLVKKLCNGEVNDRAIFEMFIFHITKDYLEMLDAYNLNKLDYNQIIGFSIYKINSKDVAYWKKVGLNKMNADELISKKIFLKGLETMNSIN